MLQIIYALVDDVIVPLIDAFSRAIFTKQFWYGVAGLVAVLMVAWMFSDKALGEFFSWEHAKTGFGFVPAVQDFQAWIESRGNATSEVA